MKLAELRSLDNKTLGLHDDDSETLENDDSKGACIDGDGDNNNIDDDNDNSEDSNDDDSDDDKIKFCKKAQSFVVLKGTGRISDFNLPKIM